MILESLGHKFEPYKKKPSFHQKNKYWKVFIPSVPAFLDLGRNGFQPQMIRVMSMWAQIAEYRLVIQLIYTSYCFPQYLFAWQNSIGQLFEIQICVAWRLSPCCDNEGYPHNISYWTS